MAKYENDLVRKTLVLHIPRICKASGYMLANRKFVVLKGSKIRFRRNTDKAFFNLDEQEMTLDLVDQGIIVDTVFTKDYTFASRELASNIIMQKNYPCDGLWKDPENGMTVQELKRAERFKKMEDKNLSSPRIPGNIRKNQSLYWACFSGDDDEVVEGIPEDIAEEDDQPDVCDVSSCHDLFQEMEGVEQTENGFLYRGREYLEKDGYVPCVFLVENREYSGRGVFRKNPDGTFSFVLLNGSTCRNTFEITNNHVNKIVKSIPGCEVSSKGFVRRDIEFNNPGDAMIFVCRYSNINSKKWKLPDGTILPESEIYRQLQTEGLD